MATTHFRTCPLCEAGCGLEITVDGGAVTRIRGDLADVYSKGFICPKGSTLRQLHDDPDRLRRPLVRRDGELVEVQARITVYEGRGDLQLIVERMQRAGQGAGQARREFSRQRPGSGGFPQPVEIRKLIDESQAQADRRAVAKQPRDASREIQDGGARESPMGEKDFAANPGAGAARPVDGQSGARQGHTAVTGRPDFLGPQRSQCRDGRNHFITQGGGEGEA